MRKKRPPIEEIEVGDLAANLEDLQSLAVFMHLKWGCSADVIAEKIDEALEPGPKSHPYIPPANYLVH